LRFSRELKEPPAVSAKLTGFNDAVRWLLIVAFDTDAVRVTVRLEKPRLCTVMVVVVLEPAPTDNAGEPEEIMKSPVTTTVTLTEWVWEGPMPVTVIV